MRILPLINSWIKQLENKTRNLDRAHPFCIGRMVNLGISQGPKRIEVWKMLWIDVRKSTVQKNSLARNQNSCRKLQSFQHWRNLIIKVPFKLKSNHDLFLYNNYPYPYIILKFEAIQNFVVSWPFSSTVKWESGHKCTICASCWNDKGCCLTWLCSSCKQIRKADFYIAL